MPATACQRQDSAVPAVKLQITLAGRERVVEAGTTAGEALSQEIRNGASPAHAVIAARVNGELRDLACPLADSDAVEPVSIGSADGLAIIRDSSPHVPAQAVPDLFPGATLWTGPPTGNGSYYDFA